MKKLILSASVVASLFAAPTIESLQKQILELQKQLEELKAAQQKQNELKKEIEDLKAKQEKQDDRYYKKVAPIVSNTHLFWSLDLRSSLDYIHQKTTSGAGYTKVTPNLDGTVTFSDFSQNITSKKYYNNILYNRVILTGVYKPSDNLKATLKLQVNNMYGMNHSANNSPYNNISWVASETPDDTNVRLKEAFFNYYFGDDLMFSAGRRPATNGYPANLREGDEPNSPLAHLINMEFDGFSFKIGNGEFSKLSDKFSDYGTWIKFCAGRVYSPSQGKWPMSGAPAYSKDSLKITDFYGVILVPYDDGQYSLWTETVWAKNMKGNNFVTQQDAQNAQTGNPFNVKMDDLGDYFGFNAIIKASGIGDGINDFLDDTNAFISFALSKTKPDNGKQMLGSMDDKTGISIWMGADMPAGEKGRFGFNVVKGSKYWRSMTYGEDTLAGSIAAIRGKAYDVYYIREIIPNLSASLRAKMLDYDYAGSDAFFGIGGDPNAQVFVEKATDVRAYIRYKF